MRINKWLAAHTDLSRRKADEVIAVGRVRINGSNATMGSQVEEGDHIFVDGREIFPVEEEHTTIMLNKPVDYVCSRRGQGSKTIYELIPSALQHLKPLGRLDKESSGLLLMSSDGNLINKLTHPSFNHKKVYVVTLNRPLGTQEEAVLTKGVDIGDRTPSRLRLRAISSDRTVWEVTLSEGRNRQIRRSFASVRYKVEQLHRTHFASYALSDLDTGKYTTIVL